MLQFIINLPDLLVHWFGSFNLRFDVFPHFSGRFCLHLLLYVMHIGVFP